MTQTFDTVSLDGFIIRYIAFLDQSTDLLNLLMFDLIISLYFCNGLLKPQK